jgi:predicted phage terminase large subunit-like protein
MGQSEDWDHLTLPAIAHADEVIPVSAEACYDRKIGEPLSPEREPLNVLEALKLQIGSDAFAAQYQQTPVPPGGAMVKRHWIVRYSELPPMLKRLVTVQSWDTASKGGPENDWSVCTTWIVTHDRSCYLADVWRRRVDYPALRAAAQELAVRWSARRVLVEDMGAGTSLAQELRRTLPGVIAVKPEGDKASRMAVASAMFESGKALLPERAPWLADLETELFSFPGGRHDDQCDSISQALLDQNSSSLRWISAADWDRLTAVLSLPPRRLS